VELIDGHPVMEQQIRFRLRTIVDERYADQIRDGETMVWIVRALCKPPQYYPLGKEADERYKLAVQDVESAAPLDGEARISALAYLDGGGDQLVLPFHGEDELTELRAHLSAIGELRDGERLIDTFRRLAPGTIVIEEPPHADVPPERPGEHVNRTGAERYLDERLDDEEYAGAYARAGAVLRGAELPEPPQPHLLPASAAPDHDDVEVVGSIYRGGRSALTDLLDTKFGEP
jgi:hypothetical protein